MSPDNNSTSRRPGTSQAKTTTLKITDRLTESEIESLRNHGRAVQACAREAFKDWRPDAARPGKPVTLLASDRLIESEIEQLRRDKKEASAYGRKAFKDWRPDRVP